MQGLGNCYRMRVQDTNCEDPLGGLPLDREIITINTGSDVANIQFDLQIGNGGTGAFNDCAGQITSMFPGIYGSLNSITAQVLGLSLCGELLMVAVTIEIALKAALVVMTCRHTLRY